MSSENPNILQQLSLIEDVVRQKRSHPRRIANLYLSGQHPTLLRQPDSPTTTENPVFTDDEEEEIFGLHGIVIDWMVDGASKMREQRPPYGLIYPKSGFNENLSANNMKVLQNTNLLGNPYTTFSATMHCTLADALREKLKRVFAAPEGREARIYGRHMEYARRIGPRSDDPDGIKYTASSSNGGLQLMGDVLSHTADIDSTFLGRKPTTDESVDAARNSTPLIRKLSTYEKNVFNFVKRLMSEGGIWRSLIIVENGEKMYYQIKNPVLQAVINQLSKPDIKESLGKNKRQECPAGMSFDGRKSAIETLWNWYIDYSVQVSQHNATITRGL